MNADEQASEAGKRVKLVHKSQHRKQIHQQWETSIIHLCLSVGSSRELKLFTVFPQAMEKMVMHCDKQVKEGNLPMMFQLS